MDIIRRNTDYAFQLILNLSNRFGKSTVSSKSLAEEENISYPLTCKLLQIFHSAGLVKSKMGPLGGYYLCQSPSEISLATIIELIQGPIKLNKCLLGIDVCPKKDDCPIYSKLYELQEYMEHFFNNITLEKLLEIKKTISEIKMGKTNNSN